MRATCKMSRWIDPGRPQELTQEQSSSVDQHPRVRKLIAARDELKRRYKGRATARPAYQKLGREIANERQWQSICAAEGYSRGDGTKNSLSGLSSDSLLGRSLARR
jgi:hypothetical protein